MEFNIKSGRMICRISTWETVAQASEELNWKHVLGKKIENKVGVQNYSDNQFKFDRFGQIQCPP